jgi:hypothetical protein
LLDECHPAPKFTKKVELVVPRKTPVDDAVILLAHFIRGANHDEWAAGGAGAGEINSEVILNAEVGSAALDPAVGAPPQDEAP